MAARGGEELLAVREPTVARGPGVSAPPLFSLTLTLSRQPLPDEVSLAPLVRGGAFTTTLDVSPTDAELSSAFPEEKTRPSALFLRGAQFALVTASGQRVVEASSGGFGGRVVLKAALDTELALAFLGALRGEASGLEVVAELTYRAPPAVPPPPPFTLDLPAVFEFLELRAAEDRTFSEVELVSCFAELIERGSVLMREAEADAATFARVNLVELAAACRPFLVRVRELETRFVLVCRKAEPAAEPSAAASADVTRTLTLGRPLQALLEPLTRRYPVDALVKGVCPARDGGFEPVAARQRRTRAVAPRPILASFGGQAMALNVALRTGRIAKLDALILAQSGLATRPPAPGRWELDDVVQVPANDGIPLPLLDDANAPLWPDRIDPALFWYAPALTLVTPAPTETPSASPFLFSFRTVGHDATGQPGLEATIRVRLRPGMSEATQKAWEAKGKPSLKPVPLGGVSVSLEIPFRDPSGRTSSQAVKASSVTKNGGDYEATFLLTDQWARLAYGSLAFADFQELPARLGSSYVFKAAVRSARSLSSQPGRRIAAIPVMRARPTFPVDPTTINFPPTADPEQPRPTAGFPAPTLPTKAYVVQTQGRTQVVDVRLPCSTFGAFYVQVANGTVKAIGCQNAFKLGVVELKLFEAVPLDFSVPAPFKVLRSLQVPGRFLVLPASYTVARFEPGDSRAYRPALFLFANIDTDERERTQCVVTATLEPAVSAYWRDALLAKLETSVHPSPELIWPSDLGVVPTFEWALSGTGSTAVQVEVVHTPDGFQVTLATGVNGVLLLKSMIERSGVVGSATFALADGALLRAPLVVDLAHVSGPFVAGPVEIAVTGNDATLTNRLEQPVDVGALALRAGTKRQTVAVEKRLAPGQSVSVALPAGASRLSVDVAPVGGATSFEEVRTYVEDIYVVVTLFANIDWASTTSVSVEARITGVGGSVHADLRADNARSELTLLLPLTTYVAQPTLQFAITRTPRTGKPVTGPWRDWRLDTLGSVIEIRTSDLP
jgi:hypothetical protein